MIDTCVWSAVRPCQISCGGGQCYIDQSGMERCMCDVGYRKTAGPLDECLGRYSLSTRPQYTASVHGLSTLPQYTASVHGLIHQSTWSRVCGPCYRQHRMYVVMSVWSLLQTPQNVCSNECVVLVTDTTECM